LPSPQITIEEPHQEEKNLEADNKEPLPLLKLRRPRVSAPPEYLTIPQNKPEKVYQEEKTEANKNQPPPASKSKADITSETNLQIPSKNLLINFSSSRKIMRQK